MNLGELRAAVKERLGVPAAGDSSITDAWANGAVNAALTAVSSEKPWWWLLSSVTFQFNGGQAAMPSDLMKVEAIQAYGGVLEPVSRRDMLDQDMAPLSVFGWTVLGNVLWLVPAPEGLVAARMLYYRAEPVLVADGDVPLIPAVYHQKVVAYATYLGYSKRQDPVRAAPLLADYKDWVARTQADQSPVKGPRRARTQPRRTTIGPSTTTLPAQPAITVGGIIVCTSATRPLGVDGQVILETDTRRLLDFEAGLGWKRPQGITYLSAASSPPALFNDGDFWFQTDTRALYVRRNAVGAWLPLLGTVLPCTSSTRPTSPYKGQPIYETDTDRLMYYTTATTGWQPPWNLPWGFITSGSNTSAQSGIATTATAISGMSVTWTAVAHRRYHVRVWLVYTHNTTDGMTTIRLRDAANATLAFEQRYDSFVGQPRSAGIDAVLSPVAGSVTYNVSLEATAGTNSTAGSGTATSLILVTDIGPNGAPT